MIEQHYLDDCLFQLRKLKAQADKAMAQVDDAQFSNTSRRPRAASAQVGLLPEPGVVASEAARC